MLTNVKIQSIINLWVRHYGRGTPAGNPFVILSVLVICGSVPYIVLIYSLSKAVNLAPGREMLLNGYNGNFHIRTYALLCNTGSAEF